MGKRFIDTERYRQALRGVDPKLRLAHEWLWANCDPAGVWRYDADLFKFECGYKLDVDALLRSCPWIKRLPNGALFIADFVTVNHGALKPGYNPHKPVFRSFEANGIDPDTLQFQDLPNPSPRVEVVYEEEDNVSRKEPAPEDPITWPVWAGPQTIAAWEDFKHYRLTEKKERYKSAKTEQRAVNILAKYFTCGQDCVEALEHSMGKGWLFPVDPTEYKYPTQQEADV
jgi:hypothetical protein